MKHTQLLFSLLIVFISFITSTVFWEGSDHSSMEHSSHSSSIQSQSATVADGDTLEIKSVGADLSYDITTINAKAGSELTLKYVNQSDMPHNIVLVFGEGDIQPVGVAALRASQNQYIPENEADRMIAYTNLIAPGESGYVTFTVPDPGTYPYICTYAGHFTMMQGRLNSTE